MTPSGVQAKEARAVDDGRPTVADLRGDNHFATFAKTHWLKGSGKSQLRQEQLKTELWDVLEREGFSLKSLLILENLQILEKYICTAAVLVAIVLTMHRYLWPNYSEESTNFHVLLMALIVNIKIRENLPAWGQ